MGIRPVSKTGAPGLPLQGNWRYARVPVGAPVHAPVPTLNTNDSYLTRSAPPRCPKPRVLQPGARACSASRDASVDGLYCSAVRLSGQLNVSRYSEAGGDVGCTCHVLGVTKRCRLERIVRPQTADNEV